MGLDNGITIHNVPAEDIPNIVAPHTPITYGEPGFEICYMRKCWGIRNAINAILHTHESETVIDREDIPAIIKLFKKFLNPTYWEEYADSIWEYDDMVDSMIAYMINLSWLYKYMESHPNVVVKWYDSF